ncbi:MAG: insulinase family protein [Actinobacteria bacterium]|nr:insulinase family protein [Actinomycetota bacterium]
MATPAAVAAIVAATATVRVDVIADLVTDLRITTLDSGLTVATERVPGALSVAAGVWVGVGSRDEPDALSGVSHFLEHLLFKGTDARSAQELARGVDRRGGDFNAFTAKEFTAYYCRLPARHSEHCLELLGEVLTRPALRDDDVNGERQVILEELAMDDDSPDDVAHRKFSAAVFHGHALGRDPAGDRDHVQAITPDDVRSFFAEHYRAEAMVVAAAGPLPHDEMLAGITDAFVGVATGGVRPQRSSPELPGQGLTVSDDTEQVHIVMGGRGLRRDDPRREALDVVNHVLGGGLASRLFEEIRERRGLAYSVYSGLSSYADAGLFQLYAGTQPQHAAEVQSLMHEELCRLIADGITDEELDIAVGYLTGAFELGLEDTGARMSRTGGQLITTGAVRPIEEQVARWASVDQAAASSVIADVLTVEPIVVKVGPVS